MIRRTKLYHLSILLLVTLLMITVSKTNYAQNALTDSLKHSIDSIKVSLSILDSNKSQLTNSFYKINVEIYKLKSDLKENDNILQRFKLENLLKKATFYADSIVIINRRIKFLNARLTQNYHKIISELDSLIKRQADLLKSAKGSEEIVTIINNLHQLEDNKQLYQSRMANILPLEKKTPPLIIEPDDTIDRMRLKINILKDRINRVQNEQKYLLKRKEELKSDRSIYEEMLSFIHDLKQNIDEEQEFYDQDRLDQLISNIKNIDLKISSIDELLMKLKNNNDHYNDLLDKFKNYVQTLLRKNIK